MDFSSLFDKVENKKFISTIILFILGVAFYTPYFIRISYLPMLGTISLFSIIFLLIGPLFFLIFLPFIIMYPAYIWDMFIDREWEITEKIFYKKSILNDKLKNIFWFIIGPSISISMLILAALFSYNLIMIIFSIILLISLAVLLLKLNSKKEFFLYFFNLIISNIVLIVILFSFLAVFELKMEAIYVGDALFLVCSIFVFTYVYLVLLILWFRHLNSIRRYVLYFFIGWGIISVVFGTRGGSENNSNLLLNILETPGRLTLRLFGRGGGIVRDISLNEDFCNTTGIIPSEQSICLPYNRYKDVKVLLDLGNIYLEFKDGSRLELDKNKYGYLEKVAPPRK